MALKRLIPIQDTFIIDNYSYGSDEILELGCVQDLGTNHPARILMQFSSDQIKALIAGIPDEQTGSLRATLHLNISEAENLPGIFTIEARELTQDWAEGLGRVGDMSKEGASWKDTGIQSERWDEPGAISGSVEPISQEINTRELLADLDLDLTDTVLGWNGGESNKGLILTFGNEDQSLDYGSRMSFYSKETHTIYRPYLELKWNDSIYETGSLTECNDFYGTFTNNLREEYTVGDQARVDFTIKDVYAPRIWSTSSIYQPTHVLPSSSYWGIKDEYTNEMIVDFDPISTKISTDGSGSFFILDTSNLEPERYYRLLVRVNKHNQTVIVDNKNIFRVGRNGKHQG